LTATAAEFVGTIVRQVSLRRTVNNHRYEKVGRTPHLSSSTCLVLTYCPPQRTIIPTKAALATETTTN